MRTVYLIARILLGLMYAAVGMNGFAHFMPNPTSIPSTAMAFFSAR